MLLQVVPLLRSPAYPVSKSPDNTSRHAVGLWRVSSRCYEDSVTLLPQELKGWWSSRGEAAVLHIYEPLPP